jgi:hypothetical protein
MRTFLFLAVLACAPPAAAQLYRWIDPESGSVKLSSYPPPWYGDPALERRGPKVEVIPAGKPPPAQPGTTDAEALPGMAQPAVPAQDAAVADAATKRRAMLRELAAALGAGTTISPALQKRIEEFTALSEHLDRADPAGAAARLAEVQAAMQAAARSPAK